MVTRRIIKYMIWVSPANSSLEFRLQSQQNLGKKKSEKIREASAKFPRKTGWEMLIPSH